ncbi:MAG: hypothetical protein M0007_15265, partial [Actinomycetota bacterium]|nr:hypothetical protein [Actinomycetota bacterium]
MSLSDIVGILVTTVILGSIYGLVAIGMTLIYGTLRILDMSQGSMVMVGSFIGWGILVVAGWNPIIAIVLAFVATFGLGTLTQLVSVQPLMKRMNSIDFEMVTFITTFAVAMILSNVALEVLGPQQRNVTPVISGGINVYHGVNLPYQSLTMAIVSVVMMAGLGIFLARTRWGMAIRAVAQDLDAARLMGVPVSKLYPLTMGLASALAGVAVVLMANRQDTGSEANRASAAASTSWGRPTGSTGSTRRALATTWPPSDSPPSMCLGRSWSARTGPASSSPWRGRSTGWPWRSTTKRLRGSRPRAICGTASPGSRFAVSSRRARWQRLSSGCRASPHPWRSSRPRTTMRSTGGSRRRMAGNAPL